MIAVARHAALPLLTAFGLVLVVDLVTKALAVRDPQLFGAGLIHNPVMPTTAVRFAVCLTTVACVAVMARLAAAHGTSSIPVTWVAAGLLVGGTLGNWSSGLIWQPGVPDFISGGDRMWNLADFAIGSGMVLLFCSSLGYAIATYVRGRRTGA